MRKILSVNESTTIAGVALLIARIGIATLMLIHGIPKLMMLFSEAPVQFPGVMGMSARLSLSLAVFAEVACSLFILAGFATRIATVPLIITMLTALFVIHAADPFTRQEPALYYLLVYVVLLIAGSGKYSVDYLLQRKRATISNTNHKVKDSTFAIYQ